MDYTVHGILQARITEWVPVPFSRASSQPRDQTQVSTLQADSLPAEPQGKPKGILLSHKNNEIMPFEATRMDLEMIILSEVSQTNTI